MAQRTSRKTKKKADVVPPVLEDVPAEEQPQYEPVPKEQLDELLKLAADLVKDLSSAAEHSTSLCKRIDEDELKMEKGVSFLDVSHE